MDSKQTNMGAFTEARKACFKMPDKYKTKGNKQTNKQNMFSHTCLSLVEDQGQQHCLGSGSWAWDRVKNV